MIFDSVDYEIDSKQILQGVDLRIEPGKICGLFGPNGGGKTTLIKIGAGLLLPTRGTVFIDRQAFIEKKLLQRYQKIAYLSQETFLPRDMSVSKFLNTFRTKADDCASEYYPSRLMNQQIGSLSSGEVRLLELIFIISLDRIFLLLDEPFTGIEPLIIDQGTNLHALDLQGSGPLRA